MSRASTQALKQLKWLIVNALWDFISPYLRISMYLTNMSYVRHLKYAKVNLNAYNLKLFDTQNRQATCLFFYMVLGSI